MDYIDLEKAKQNFTISNKNFEAKLLEAIQQRYKLTETQSLLKLQRITDRLCSSEIKTMRMREIFKNHFNEEAPQKKPISFEREEFDFDSNVEMMAIKKHILDKYSLKIIDSGPESGPGQPFLSSDEEDADSDSKFVLKEEDLEKLLKKNRPRKLGVPKQPKNTHEWSYTKKEMEAMTNRFR